MNTTTLTRYQPEIEIDELPQSPNLPSTWLINSEPDASLPFGCLRQLLRRAPAHGLAGSVG